MNAIGRLGEMFPNLAPGTLAGLANVSGMSGDEGPAAAVEAPAAEMGSAGGPAPAANDVAPAAAGPAPAFAPAQGQAAAVSTDPRAASSLHAKITDEPFDASFNQEGAANDSFPTVKPMGGDAGTQMGAASQAHVIPAGWQPGPHSVSMTRGMSPEELEPVAVARDAAAGHSLLASDERDEAAARHGQADAAYLAQKAAAEQHFAAIDAARQVRQQTYVADEMAKLDQLNTNAQKQVDPKAYWKEHGAVGSVLTGLMVGLGQFASMWKGGTNAALQIVDDNVNANIQSQKDNIANAHHALANEMSLYRQNLDAFGDEERATLATKMQYLDHVKTMVDGIRVGANAAESQAARHDLLAQLLNKQADYKQQIAQLTHTGIAEQMSEHYRPAMAVGGVGDKGHDPLYVATLGGYARDPETARKLNEKGALRMQIGENMHSIYGLLEEAKGTHDPLKLDDIQKRIQAKVNDSLTKNTVLEGQGAMSEGDKAVAAEAKGLKGVDVMSPNFSITRQQKRIVTAAIDMQEQHRLEGEAYGIQKGSEQYVAGPNGPVPVRKLEGRTAAPSKRTMAVDDLVRPPKGKAKK